MTTISAKVIADSISEEGKSLTTIRCRYPKWIHAEGRTHRMLCMTEIEYPDDYDEQVYTWEELKTPSPMADRNLSRNAASSRAIPVRRLIEDIYRDPAVPIFWGSKQPGMQAGAELEGEALIYAKERWRHAMEDAIAHARRLDDLGCAKQIVNRILEPFMHIDTLFTATEWSNFFTLRIHEAAEPHIRLLAECMKQAMDESTPKLLLHDEWHLPYVSDEEREEHRGLMIDPISPLIKLSVARCAHLSYETVEGTPLGKEQAERIYDKLLGSQPVHASPAEHQATPDRSSSRGPLRVRQWERPSRHGNFVGWLQFRKMIPGECA